MDSTSNVGRRQAFAARDRFPPAEKVATAPVGVNAESKGPKTLVKKTTPGTPKDKPPGSPAAPHFNFYHDEPLFGLDIGYTSMKVMQLAPTRDRPKVVGYGVSNFYPMSLIQNGEIVNFKGLAKYLHELFEDGLIGSISTRRVACSIPTSHTFSRPMKLPPMEKDELAEAVHLEAEQYIPVPAEKLYLDYDILRSDEEGTDLLVVATPKNIIDSYMKFLELVGLEPVAMEPTMNATARLFGLADPSHAQPSVLVDFGSIAVDLAVFDKTIFVNSTVNGGSDTLTTLIAQQLGISVQQAFGIKSKYGISYSEKLGSIMNAAQPILDNLIRETRKIIRYYDERTSKEQKITQIITTGGGATLSGLSEFLSRQLNLPTRMLDPWHKIDFGELGPPTELAKSMYITVAGEAILNPKELFA